MNIWIYGQYMVNEYMGAVARAGNETFFMMNILKDKTCIVLWAVVGGVMITLSPFTELVSRGPRNATSTWVVSHLVEWEQGDGHTHRQHTAPCPCPASPWPPWPPASTWTCPQIAELSRAEFEEAPWDQQDYQSNRNVTIIATGMVFMDSGYRSLPSFRWQFLHTPYVHALPLLSRNQEKKLVNFKS